MNRCIRPNRRSVLTSEQSLNEEGARRSNLCALAVAPVVFGVRTVPQPLLSSAKERV
jgi:hypothetical protein